MSPNTTLTISPGAHAMSIPEFQATIGPLEGYDSLADMYTDLVADPVELRVIKELVEELRRDQCFRVPIRVEDQRISNGCHRYCAYLLAGATSIDVWVVENNVFEPAAPDEHCVATFKVAPLDGSYPSGVDDFSATVMTAARSFSYKGVWIESDGGSMSQDLAAYDYYASVSTILGAVPTIIERLRDFGVSASLVTIDGPDADA